MHVKNQDSLIEQSPESHASRLIDLLKPVYHYHNFSQQIFPATIVFASLKLYSSTPHQYQLIMPAYI